MKGETKAINFSKAEIYLIFHILFQCIAFLIVLVLKPRVDSDT